MEYAEYIDKNEYVILYRLYGEGGVAEIPQTICGKTVKILADHLFANEPSVQYDKGQIRRCALNGLPGEESPEDKAADRAEDTAEDPAADTASPVREKALCGSCVEMIRIPEGVEAVGNYAFYGCQNLKEVSFPSTMKRIGYGMFNGCGRVRRLEFHLEDNGDRRADIPCSEQTPPIMKEVLDAVSDRIEAVVRCGAQELWRLTFPDYYEEGRENTPARIIEIVYHGTGYQYRNCFLNRRIQPGKYDEVFPYAQAQESTDTCISIARNRLRCAPEPAEKWMNRYIEYLRSEERALMEAVLSDTEHDPVGELKILSCAGFFTSSNIDSFIETASQHRRSDAVSFLMNVKHQQFSSARAGRYEL